MAVPSPPAQIHRLLVQSKMTYAVVFIHTDRNALDLNCHFYVVEATLENKCMCFQDYDYVFRKGVEKIYQASPSNES